jgi:hypothetical protein
MKIYKLNLGKQIGYFNSSQKITQLKKKKPKQSPGSKVMSILNSTIFQGFSGESHDFLQ